MRDNHAMGIHHVALRCADVRRSLAFYAEVLGLEVLKENFTEDGLARSAWLRAGDVIVMLERQLAGGGPQEGSGHLLAFAVDDLDTWEKRLAAAGVAIEQRSEWSLYFNDPDGHRVAVTVHRD